MVFGTKLRWSLKSTHVLSVLFITLLCVQCRSLAENDKLNAKTVGVIAKVKEQKLEFYVELGKATGDSDFDFIAGGCVSKLKTIYSDSSTFTAVKNATGDDKGDVSNLKKVEVTEAGVKFTGSDIGEAQVECTPKFVSVDDGFTIALNLTGTLPDAFKMASDAELYTSSNETTGFQPWMLHAIIYLVCVFLLSSIVGRVMSIVRYRRLKYTYNVKDREVNFEKDEKKRVENALVKAETQKTSTKKKSGEPRLNRITLVERSEMFSPCPSESKSESTC